MASQATFLMQQFLSWVDARPRRVSEVREAWSSTCPLNCAWEDALADDLVGYDRDGRLVLTAQGRARLVGRTSVASSAEADEDRRMTSGFRRDYPPYA